MKIQVEAGYRAEFVGSVEDFLARELQFTWYDNVGVMERTEGDVDELRKAVGRLCNILANRGMLTADDVTSIGGGYSSGATFCK